MSDPIETSPIRRSTIFTLGRLVAVVLLFWALAPHSINYFTWLRWVVTAVAAWGLYLAIKSQGKELLTVFYFIIAVMFNPIKPLTYQRATWAIIDVIAALFILFSLFVHENYFSQKVFNGRVVGLITALLTVGIGVGLLVFSGYLIYGSCKEVYASYKLDYYGKETQGKVHRVEYDSELYEDDRGHGELHEFFRVEYSFMAGNTEVTGYNEQDDSPLDEVSEDQYEEVRKDEWVVNKGQEIPIAVVYEQGNPENNKTVSGKKGVGSAIFDALLMLAFVIFLPLNGAWSLLNSGHKRWKESLVAAQPDNVLSTSI